MSTRQMPKPLPVRSATRCLFCRSRACYCRIYTPCGTYDHVACRRHSNALYLHADEVLGNPGLLRVHSSGTSLKERGNAAKAYAEIVAWEEQAKEWRITEALRKEEGIWV